MTRSLFLYFDIIQWLAIFLLLWRVIALSHRIWSVEDDAFDLLERVEQLEVQEKEVPLQ